MTRIKNLLRKLKWKRARQKVLKRFTQLMYQDPPRAPRREEGESYPQWLKRAEAYWRKVNRYYRLYGIEEREERKKR